MDDRLQVDFGLAAAGDAPEEEGREAARERAAQLVHGAALRRVEAHHPVLRAASGQHAAVLLLLAPAYQAQVEKGAQLGARCGEGTAQLGGAGLAARMIAQILVEGAQRRPPGKARVVGRRVFGSAIELDEPGGGDLALEALAGVYHSGALQAAQRGTNGGAVRLGELRDGQRRAGAQRGDDVALEIVQAQRARRLGDEGHRALGLDPQCARQGGRQSFAERRGVVIGHPGDELEERRREDGSRVERRDDVAQRAGFAAGTHFDDDAHQAARAERHQHAHSRRDGERGGDAIIERAELTRGRDEDDSRDGELRAALQGGAPRGQRRDRAVVGAGAARLTSTTARRRSHPPAARRRRSKAD